MSAGTFITLSGDNSAAGGGVTLTAGVLYINSATALGTGTFTINGGTIGNNSAGAVILTTNNAQSWNGNFSYSGSNGNSLDLGTGAVTLGGNIQVTVNNWGSLTVGGAIGDGGSAYTLTKAGANTLILGGANTFTGGTTITTGFIQLNNALALQNSTVTVSYANGLKFGPSIGTFTVSGLAGASNFALTDTGSVAVTLQAGQNNADTTYSGIMSGTGGAFTKQGSGTLTLSGANTYTGATTISAGTLSVASLADGGSASNIGASTNAAGNLVLGGGTLLYTGSTVSINRNFTLSAGTTSSINPTNTLTISGAGAATTGGLTKTGSGTLVLSGNNAYTGLTTLILGTLTLSGDNSVASGGVTLTAGTLNINSATALGTGTFTINGGTINNSTAGAITLTTNNIQVWNANFSYDLTHQNLNLGTGAVTLGANVQIAFSTGYIGSLTVGGAIGDGGQAYTLTKLGSNASATLILSGANTYDGLTTVSAGTLTLSGDNSAAGGGVTLTAGMLNINSATALGTGTFTINGGTISNSTAGAITLSTNNIQVWNANFSYILTHQNLNLGTGAVTLGANIQVSTGASYIGNLTIGGAIGDGGNGYTLTKAASGGALILSGANTYDGLTTVSAGTLTLSGDNSAAGGGVTLTAGMLNINSATALGTGTFTINGGAINNSTAGAITLTTNNIQAWNGDFTFGTTKSLNLGTGAVTLGGNRSISASFATLTVGGAIGDGGHGYTLTTATSYCSIILAGNNTYTGLTTISTNGGNNSAYNTTLSGDNTAASGGVTLSSGGVLIIGSATALGTGTFTINGGTIGQSTSGTITLTTNNVQAWNGDLNFVGGYNLNLGTGAVTLGGNRQVTVNGGGYNPILTVGGVIGDGGNGYTLTAAGSVLYGTLVLSGANTYTGATTISSSSCNLQLGNANALQNSTVTVSTNNALKFGPSIGTFTVGGLAGASNFALTDTGSAAVTLQAGQNNASTAYSGIMSGTNGALVKQGTGTLTLSGANTFTGATTIGNGTLSVSNLVVSGSASNLGNASSAIVLGDGTNTGILSYTGNGETCTRGFTLTTGSSGEIDVTGANALTISGVVSGSGNLIKGSTGTLTLSGNNSSASGVTITAGTLALSGTTNLNVSGNWSNSGTFTANQGTVTLTNSSTFSDTSSFYNLTINGSGKTVTLGGALTVTNNLTITAGTLDVSASGCSGASCAVSVGGTWSNAGTFTARTGTVTFNSTATGKTITSGAQSFYNLTFNGTGGGWTLQDNLVATGALTHTAGTLSSGGKNITTTGNLIISDGALVTASGLVGSTVTVGGNFSASGHVGALLALNPASTWYLNVTGTANASYVNADYSDASGGVMIMQTNSTDGGNNTHWSFDITAPTVTDNVPDGWQTDDITVTLTCDDGEGLGCDKVYYTLDGTTPTAASPLFVNAASAWQFTYATTTSAEATLKYRGADTLGNLADTVTAVNLLQIDKVAPVISNLTPATGATITATGQAVSFTLNKTGDCRVASTAKSYDGMAGDTACTVANGIQMTCTLPTLSSGAQSLYFACQDYLGNKDTALTATAVSYTVPVAVAAETARTSSGGSIRLIFPTLATVPKAPAGPFGVVINNGARTVGDSKVMLKLVAGADTTAVVISINPDFSDALVVPYIPTARGLMSLEYNLCRGNNECLSRSYTVYVKFLSSSGADSPVLSTRTYLNTTSLAKQTVELAKQLGQGVAEMVKFFQSEPSTALNYPPLNIAVPKTAPLALQNKLTIVPPTLNNFIFASLPTDFRAVVNKFPQIENTLNKVGVTRLSDAGELEVAKISLPGLGEVTGLAQRPNISIANLSGAQTGKVPSNIVFARASENNLDLTVRLSISNQGVAVQTLNTIVGRPLTLAIKPDALAARVRGYMVFKSNKTASGSSLRGTPKQSQIALSAGTPSRNDSNLAAVASVNIGQDTGATADRDLVLTSFEYTDSGNGIWTADVASPLVLGQYELRTVVDYANKKTAPETVSMVVIVDPEGYVYRKLSDGSEARITGASVSIFWLDPATQATGTVPQYKLWPAKDFRQDNPQTTDVTGRYAFLVPPGDYYLTATAPGYANFRSEIFKVEENKGVFMNIELKAKWGVFSVQNILLGGILLILAYVAVLFTIKRKRQTCAPPLYEGEDGQSRPGGVES